MSAILARLANEGGVLAYFSLTPYQRSVINSGRLSGKATRYYNRNGVHVVVSLGGVL